MTKLDKIDLYLINTFKKTECDLFLKIRKMVEYLASYLILANLNIMKLLSDKYINLQGFMDHKTEFSILLEKEEK